MSTLTMTTDNKDARFWDRIAPRYARKPVPDQAAYETKLAKTNGYLKPTDHVLEIGCGTGTTALHHAPNVQHLLATDISGGMIEIAQNKARDAGVDNVTFEVSSIDDLADAPATYDVIMAHSILHLVDDVPGTLRKLHGMLKPGGLLISSTPCIGDSAPWFGWVAPLPYKLGLIPKVNVFRKDAFYQCFTDAGFDFEEVWQAEPKAAHYLVNTKT